MRARILPPLFISVLFGCHDAPTSSRFVPVTGRFSATSIRGYDVPISFCINFADPPTSGVMVLAHSVTFTGSSDSVQLDYVYETSPCAGSTVPDTTRVSVRRPYRQEKDALFIEHPFMAAGIPSTYVDTGQVLSDTTITIRTHMGPFTDRPGGADAFQYRRP